MFDNFLKNCGTTQSVRYSCYHRLRSSMGKPFYGTLHKAGNEDCIFFDNVPTNALLLLHNASRGREERIFTALSHGFYVVNMNADEYQGTTILLNK